MHSKQYSLKMAEIKNGLPVSLKAIAFPCQGLKIEEVASCKSRLEEVEDALKSARWEATGGFELWCQHEGKSLSRKEQSIEQSSRLERYVQLRIEQAKLAASA